eukprot:CAMPEP_0118812402 /NCGR_PEP_ID=MMETSP1162-20130426/2271_1 /TAXON_ID=33656 /ORGANISM="Phaeocystis Sp, Strain CCMP2710" /LENGTH=55 /DNA_ID=CAMNT_0006742121 /DNA_START=67 /DNA_END=235 /DNA_ORIENTATION=+
MALFQAGVGEWEVQAHKVFEQVGAKDAYEAEGNVCAEPWTPMPALHFEVFLASRM